MYYVRCARTKEQNHSVSHCNGKRDRGNRYREGLPAKLSNTGIGIVVQQIITPVQISEFSIGVSGSIPDCSASYQEAVQIFQYLVGELDEVPGCRLQSDPALDVCAVEE